MRLPTLEIYAPLAVTIISILITKEKPVYIILSRLVWNSLVWQRDCAAIYDLETSTFQYPGTNTSAETKI